MWVRGGPTCPGSMSACGVFRASGVWPSWTLALMMGLMTIWAHETSGSVLYVWQESPAPAPPFTDWASAAHSIQEAVDAAQTGDKVLVTNGTYDVGGRAVSGLMTNRVAIDRHVVVESVTGPEGTVLEGAPAPSGGNGDGAIRCVYVGPGAILSGFTLRYGYTRASGDPFLEMSGGGVLSETSGSITNCVITGSSASLDGGGIYGGTAYDCSTESCSAEWGGGGAQCTISGGDVSFNTASQEGGGLVGCSLSGGSSRFKHALQLRYRQQLRDGRRGNGNVRQLSMYHRL